MMGGRYWILDIGYWKTRRAEHPSTDTGHRYVCLILLFAVQLALAGCTLVSNLPLLPTPSPTTTPTIPPTPTPTPTPAIVILKTLQPRDRTAPEPTPAGPLIAYTEHLDFYARPDNYWAPRIDEIGPAIEGELWRVAGKLQTEIPDERIRISIQDPSTSPNVRGMDCPARGLYFGPNDDGPLMAIFADENTSRAQVLAVAAHELAHHLTFAKFGAGGDILLSEGLANWASRETWSRWQGWPSFGAAVREYRRQGIYLPLEETLVFDPSMAPRLGLDDCFALRDLRYNEWASFVKYLIDRYGFEIIARLWQATPDDGRTFSADRSAEPEPTVPRERRTIIPGNHLPSRPDRAPTVDYTGVLDKSLQELEQDWLASLDQIRAQRAIPNTQYPVP